MQFKNIIYGFIIGDVYGTSILNNPINNDIKIHDNNILNIERGCYSFLTTNMLATIDSITENKEIIPKDIIIKLCTSLITGKYTSNNKIYLVDKESLKVLEHYRKKNNLNYIYNETDLGAYPTSRIIPIIIYNYFNEDTLDTLIPAISLTNINEIVLLGCFIYYKYLLNILEGYNKYKSLKIDIPNYFSSRSKKIYKNILNKNIFYKDIIFDDNIINVLKIVFYVILNSDNMNDVLMMISNLEGNTNLYCSLIMTLATTIYGLDTIPSDIIKDIKNKRNINKYISKFERMFL